MTEPGHLYSNNHKISHYKLNQVLTDIVLSFNRVTMLRNLARTWLLTKSVFEPEFKTRDCFGLSGPKLGLAIRFLSTDFLSNNYDHVTSVIPNKDKSIVRTWIFVQLKRFEDGQEFQFDQVTWKISGNQSSSIYHRYDVTR